MNMINARKCSLFYAFIIALSIRSPLIEPFIKPIYIHVIMAENEK
jgi:hypothetical protein